MTEARPQIPATETRPESLGLVSLVLETTTARKIENCWAFSSQAQCFGVVGEDGPRARPSFVVKGARVNATLMGQASDIMSKTSVNGTSICCDQNQSITVGFVDVDNTLAEDFTRQMRETC